MNLISLYIPKRHNRFRCSTHPNITNEPIYKRNQRTGKFQPIPSRPHGLKRITHHISSNFAIIQKTKGIIIQPGIIFPEQLFEITFFLSNIVNICPTLNVGKYRAKNKNMKLYQNNNIQIFHSRILPIRHPKPPTRLFVSLTGRLAHPLLIQPVNRTSYFLITDLYSFNHLNI